MITFVVFTTSSTEAWSELSPTRIAGIVGREEEATSESWRALNFW
jgi:hypothetical protein